MKFTALDSVMLGFNTTVVEDACRGVEVNVGDTRRALDELAAGGVRITESRQLLEAQAATERAGVAQSATSGVRPD